MNHNVVFHKRLLFNPLVKIIIGLVVCIGGIALAQLGMKALLNSGSFEKTSTIIILNITAALFALITYITLYRYYEKRDISELSIKGFSTYFLTGFLIGGTLQALTILVMYISRSFTIVAINSVMSLFPALVIALTTGVIEEVLFRGIIFRLIEEKLGSYIALVISGLIFGFVHLANPNSSIILAVGLAIQAGLLLGVAYMFSRSLWFPIAIHFAWNFTQSGIFGATTSGVSTENSLLVTKIAGSQLITGGQFGPEGSIQATLFCLLAAILLFVLAYKKGFVVQPFWKEKQLAGNQEDL